jgi:hypothetical protein
MLVRIVGLSVVSQPLLEGEAPLEVIEKTISRQTGSSGLVPGAAYALHTRHGDASNQYDPVCFSPPRCCGRLFRDTKELLGRCLGNTRLIMKQNSSGPGFTYYRTFW